MIGCVSQAFASLLLGVMPRVKSLRLRSTLYILPYGAMPEPGCHKWNASNDGLCFRFRIREPGARRRIGMCKGVLVRRFLLAAGLLPKKS